ncbi:unnamed protein product [Tuber aestivum]|uniref:Uncharacterized protein n=1 Tax=Tuber aestivum TaxID=59557 RepID=A0A292PWL3_9PEZI|nr:unnamed protein product [Tuber aestivum]
MAAALVLFCMAKRCRKEKRDPGSEGLWEGNGENGEGDAEDVAGTSRGIGRFAAGILGGNKKYREGKGLRRDGIGRAHRVDIHQISDPVFLHSSRGGIDDIPGTDQRPAEDALLLQRPQRLDWPLPMAEGEASGTTTTTTTRRVYSQRGQSSRESPSVRAVSYKPLAAEETTEDEDEGVSRGIAKGGRGLQRRMRR